MTSTPCLHPPCGNPVSVLAHDPYCRHHRAGSSTSGEWSHVPVAPPSPAALDPGSYPDPPPGYPEEASITELGSLVDRYDPASDLLLRGVDRAVFRLERVDVSALSAPTTPEEFAADAPYDEDEDESVADDAYEGYVALRDALDEGESVPPIVVYRSSVVSDGVMILDGYHRTGLALSVGRTHLWAYVGLDPTDPAT